MVDALRKLLLAGLGTLDLTEEKAKSVFNDLVARGEISERDAKELISSWSKRAAEQRGRLQADVEQVVHRTLSAIGIARHAEVEALKAKIDDLEAKLAGREG
jgi:polyhydroxyalkanoate synthesis regulator phasin